MIRKAGVYIMESAEIMGDVFIGESSSVWSKAVVRGDESYIRIGRNTNIQDLCVLHAESGIPMEIGDNVTIGHGAVIHCRKVESNCLIGIGAMLLDNSEIGEYSIVAAGSIVTENTIIPPRSLVMGVPGKIIRKINEDDMKRIMSSSKDYLRLSTSHYNGMYRHV